MKLVIIGLGAAGFAAALAARKTARDAEITIIDDKDYDLMHPCGLPFALEGRIGLKSLKHPVNIAGINKIRGKAESIDIKDKRIVLENKKEIGYDRLLIATGSSPFVPNIEGKEYAFTVKDPGSIEKMEDKIKTAKKATVVGAGAIGLETAFALSKKGIKVEVVEMLSHCFPKAIDEDISKVLEEHLGKNNINLTFNKKLEKISKNELTIMAAGVRPNIGLIKGTGIKTGDFGIVANEKMQTSVKDVYAAGDIVESRSLINDKPFAAWIATTAYKQGTVAGINMAGGKAEFKGTLAPLISVIGDIEVGATGFNSYTAKKYGYETVEGKARSKTRPDWFGGAEDITVKVIADKKTGRILGGQAIGKNVKEKIDIISAAITAGFTLKQLSDLELAYCPAVSQTYDVLTQACDMGLRKQNIK